MQELHNGALSFQNYPPFEENKQTNKYKRKHYKNHVLSWGWASLYQYLLSNLQYMAKAMTNVNMRNISKEGFAGPNWLLRHNHHSCIWKG